jgi:hypothetical protein
MYLFCEWGFCDVFWCVWDPKGPSTKWVRLMDGLRPLNFFFECFWVETHPRKKRCRTDENEKASDVDDLFC